LLATGRSVLDPSSMQTSMYCRDVVGSNACRRSSVVSLRVANEESFGPLQPEVGNRRL